jgi:hypothetical protein
MYAKQAIAKKRVKFEEAVVQLALLMSAFLLA